MGLQGSTSAPTDVNPSTLKNIAGVGWDSTDSNLQIFINGAGTTAKTDLGSDFPIPRTERTSSYEIALFSAPNGTTIGYEVTDSVSGKKATGTLSSNLPANTLLLAPRGWVSVGGSASAIGFSLMLAAIETDY